MLRAPKSRRPLGPALLLLIGLAGPCAGQPVVSPSQLEREPVTNPATMSEEEKAKRSEVTDKFLVRFGASIGGLVVAIVGAAAFGRARRRRRDASAGDPG